MIMTQTLQKWGNSAGIRIPKSVMRAGGLNIGQRMEVTYQDNSVILTPLNDKEQTLDSILANVVPSDVGGEMDWGTDVGAERYE